MSRARLGTNLVDSLVTTIDSLRTALYPDFGVRQWNVDLVRREWSGSGRGDGTVSVLSTTRLKPMPLVLGVVDKELQPYGLDEEAEVLLKEVSLKLTEEELTGGDLSAVEEFFYKISDAHGQQLGARYYVLTQTPFPDREKDIGWILRLRRVEVVSP